MTLHPTNRLGLDAYPMLAFGEPRPSELPSGEPAAAPRPCVTFAVPGPVVGKGRPRFVRATGRAYTPAKTESYEAKVGWLAKEAMAGREPWPRGTPMDCRIVVAVEPAASWSQKKRRLALSGAIFPTGKPDSDNIAKLIGDSLNGVVWVDDTSIVRLSIQKVFRESAGLSVAVSVIGGAA